MAGTVRCGNCGSPVEYGATRCTACGVALTFVRSSEEPPTREGHSRSSDPVASWKDGGSQRLISVGDEARPVQVGAIYKSRNVNIVVNYEGSSVSMATTSKSVSERSFLLRIQWPVLGAEIGLSAGMVIALVLHFLGLALVPWLAAAAVMGAALIVLTLVGFLAWRGLPSALPTRPAGGEGGIDQTVALATLAVDHVPRLVDTAYRNGQGGKVIRTLWELGEGVVGIQRVLLGKAPGVSRPPNVPGALLDQCRRVLQDIVLLGQALEREDRESSERSVDSLAERLRRIELNLKTLPQT